ARARCPSAAAPRHCRRCLPGASPRPRSPCFRSRASRPIAWRCARRSLSVASVLVCTSEATDGDGVPRPAQPGIGSHSGLASIAAPSGPCQAGSKALSPPSAGARQAALGTTGGPATLQAPHRRSRKASRQPPPAKPPTEPAGEPHLLPLPSEPAALAIVLEVSIVNFLALRVLAVAGAEVRRATERGYPDFEIGGTAFGGGFHAVDVKAARRAASGRQTQSRITLY